MSSTSRSSRACRSRASRCCSGPRLYGADGSVLVSPATFLDPGSSDALPSSRTRSSLLATSPAVLRAHRGLRIRNSATNPATAAARRRQATQAVAAAPFAVSPVGTSSLLEVVATAPESEAARDLASAQMSSLQRFVAGARARHAGGAVRIGSRSRGSRSAGLASPRPIRDSFIGLAGGLLAGLRSGRAAGPQAPAREPGSRVAGAVGVPWLGTFTPAQAGPAGERVPRTCRGLAAPARASGARHRRRARRGDRPGRAGARWQALNERATRGLLVDGELGVRAHAPKLSAERRGAVLAPHLRRRPAGRRCRLRRRPRRSWRGRRRTTHRCSRSVRRSRSSRRPSPAGSGPSTSSSS